MSTDIGIEELRGKREEYVNALAKVRPSTPPKWRPPSRLAASARPCRA